MSEILNYLAMVVRTKVPLVVCEPTGDGEFDVVYYGRGSLEGRYFVSRHKVDVDAISAQQVEQSRLTAKFVVLHLKEAIKTLNDPYWPLGHVEGATHANPIPSMQAAIDAFVEEMLK